MQFLTGFNQEETSNIPQKGEKTVKIDVDKNLQKTPICGIDSSQTLIAPRSHPSIQNLKITTQTQRNKNPKNKN